MTKAWLIDVAAREIRAVEVDGLASWQKLVGGPIELAWQWDTGDVLYVDEEGLFKPQRHFFRLADRGDYPFAGNGLVIGRELIDDEGEYLGVDNTAVELATLQASVAFVTRAQADAWALGNASEPAVTFATVENGKVTIEVFARMGSVFADMPKPKETDDDAEPGR
jgi:hypothetical protein